MSHSHSSDQAPNRANIPHYLLGVFGLALAYALSARLGLILAVQPHITLIWPPTGIAVAVLYRAGPRYWPGVFLGVLLTGIGQHPLFQTLGIAVGNTLGPVAAAIALRGLRFDRTLTRASDLALLAGVGAAAMLIPPTFGVITLSAAGVIPSEGILWAWATWYLGDTLGVLLLAPIVLTTDRGAARGLRSRGATVAVGLLIATTAASVVSFAGLLPPPVRTMSIFPPFLMMLVVGLTQPLRLGVLHVLILAAAASAGTATGTGPFASYSNPQTRVLMVWATSMTAVAVILVLTTLTAQRDRVVRELAAVAGEYQVLVEDNPALICRFGPDGAIRYANDTFERFFEVGRDGWAGRSLYEFLRPADRAAVQTLLAQPEELRPMELKHDTARGERVVRWATRKLRLADGTIAEFHAVGLDVTAERRAEEDRRGIEAKLVETQRLEALGVLAGGVAHDFNNILTGILGHTELAAAALPPDHAVQPHLATVKDGTARAAGLVRQLLAYSGKGRFLSRPISLNTLVRQTTDLLRMTVPKKVEVRVSLEPGLPTVTADESQLQQVLMNLVINAGEAIVDAVGTVTVTTAVRFVTPDEVPEAGRYVELTVADTGCGMDDATKARLFDPFFTTKFTGRGLGLSAVLGIIRAHRGTIRVDSRPGTGSRFTVLLPADAVPAGPGIEEATPVPPDRLPPRPGRCGTALVVDHEPTVRMLGTMMLQQIGYAVIQAENGRQALDALAAHSDAIRLILLDLMMPVMDGAETLAAIRLTHPHVPVVLCSGYTADSLPAAAIGSPTTAFLRKPYMRRELRRAIASVGGNGGPPSPTPPAAAPAAG